MSTGSESNQRSRAGQVEMVHFWEEGDGQRMVEAVVDAFRSEHPGVDVIERSYSSHGLAIKSRILQETPPPVFIEWAGRNLVPYHRAGALRDLGPLWDANGWADAFIDAPRDGAMVDGTYVGVPVDIHRMNNLFYHVDVVEEYGVDPSSIADPREFLEVLDALDGGPVVGMEQPMKNPDTVLTLWANVVIGQFGADVFDEITRGDPAAHEAEVEEAVRMVAEFGSLASDDAAFNDMVAANRRFLQRESVFFQQGDWVAGEYMAADDFDYGADWDRVNFPGSDGVYMMGLDVLAAAEGASFTEATRSFLEFVGSRAGLEVLNRVKGSIPPRRDVSLEAFPPFLRDQFADFQAARDFPRGMAMQVTPEKFIEAQTALSTFVAERDVERTTADLLDAYGDE